MEGDHGEDFALRPPEERQGLIEEQIQGLVELAQNLVIEHISLTTVQGQSTDSISQSSSQTETQSKLTDDVQEVAHQRLQQIEDQISGPIEAQGEAVASSSMCIPAQEEPEVIVISPALTALNYIDIVKMINFERITSKSYFELCQSQPVRDTYEHIDEYFESLFKADSSWALAHCVSSDLAMFRGIALEFRRRYKQIHFLRKQYVRVGYVAVLNHFASYDVNKTGRFIFYLVTKDVYNQRPTYYHIYCSLVRMRVVCEILHIDKIAMPRIASGCDRMDFRRVKHLIHIAFMDSPIQIRIYTKIE